MAKKQWLLQFYIFNHSVTLTEYKLVIFWPFEVIDSGTYQKRAWDFQWMINSNLILSCRLPFQRYGDSEAEYIVISLLWSRLTHSLRVIEPFRISRRTWSCNNYRFFGLSVGEIIIFYSWWFLYTTRVQRVDRQTDRQPARQTDKSINRFFRSPFVINIGPTDSFSRAHPDQSPSHPFIRPPVRSNGRTYKMLVMFFFFFNA